MSAAFTPGPWYVAKHHSQYIFCKDDHEIAYVKYRIADDSNQSVVHGCPVTGANAQLMATAPELLADLQQAAQTMRKYEALHLAKASYDKAEKNADLAARFEATIAKATGGAA